MSAADGTLLQFQQVFRAYGRIRALAGVDLEVRAGETLALFGANGAGKTTLLRLAATLLSPSSGQLFFRGQPLDRRRRAAYRARLGFLGHASFLYDDLSARENLLLHARLHGVTDAGARVDALLQQVGLAERGHDRAAHFSRGMQQRLSLARALVGSPDLLLLDEPFSGLDGPGSEILRRALEDRRREGRCTVLSSHDLHLGLALADRYVLLERGAVRRVWDCEPLRGLAAHQVSLQRLARPDVREPVA